jgi:hypothetical protein
VAAHEDVDAMVDDAHNNFYTALNNGVGVTFHMFTVPDGVRHLRLALFNEETNGEHDLDLFLFGVGQGLVASSGSVTSNEVVNLAAPAPGPYITVVRGYENAGTRFGEAMSFQGLHPRRRGPSSRIAVLPRELENEGSEGVEELLGEHRCRSSPSGIRSTRSAAGRRGTFTESQRHCM